MKTLNNEIFVQRGETFSIDRTIENKDTTPFIISSEIANPYFLLTVSSTRYEQEKRYVYRKWISLKDFVRFKQTKIVNLKDLKSEPGEYKQSNYTGFNDSKFNSLQSFTDPVTGVVYDNLVAFGYVNNEPVLYEVGDAVFTDGTSYKYWDPDKTGNGWTDYTCRFAVMFSNQITKTWVEQNYMYSIELVSGESTLQYLRTLCEQNDIYYEDVLDVNDLVELLTEQGVEITINTKKPIVEVTFNIPLLKPTKLTVSSNINGGDV